MPDAPIGVEEALLREGQLLLDHLTPNAPAAGAPLVFPLDSRWWWQFRAVRFLLTTDANVANRLATVDITDPEGTPWVSSPSLVAVPASTVNQEYRFGQRSNGVSGIAGAPQFPDLSQEWSPGGWQLRLNVSGIQAGDTLTGIRLWVAKFVPVNL